MSLPYPFIPVIVIVSKVQEIIPFRASPQGFKMCLLGKGFHTLWAQRPAGTRSFLQWTWNLCQILPLLGPASLLAHCLVSTPFGEQPPHWHVARCLALIPFVTAQAQTHRQQILSSLSFPFRASPQDFKTRLLGKGFHTLIKSVSFSSSINVGLWDLTPYIEIGLEDRSY